MQKQTFLQHSIFEKILRSEDETFFKIKSLISEPASAVGEAYSSEVLRIRLEYTLKDTSLQRKSFIIKIPFGKEVATAAALQEMRIFPRERIIYTKLIPEFERLYKEQGKSVKFSPKYLESSEDMVILEDLSETGFQNASRVKGLNLDHCKSVLTKMAEFHAASAVYFEQSGPFDELLTRGVFTESNRAYLEAFNESLYSVLRKCMENHYKNGDYFVKKFGKSAKEFTDDFIDSGRIHHCEFNVLNHGDCWSNNIMFKYDGQQKIEETILIDFQYCKYGNPAQDLYYFILSSAELDLKIGSFEYLVKFYHDKLVENLMLLGYSKNIPKLVDIHIALFKHGVWAIMTTSGIMGAALLDPTEHASMDNYVSNDEAGNDFKTMVYANPRYIEAMNRLLPWMDCRGILD